MNAVNPVPSSVLASILKAPQIQPLYDPFIEQAGLNLFVQREDLLHPTLSGNKWYKLKWNLIKARQLGYQTLLSFGGAYSNHIHALAAAGQLFGFKTIGVIRGDELAARQDAELSPTLWDAKQNGMQLLYVSRTQYRHKQSPAFIETLKQDYGDFYCIPEGGNNLLGVQGCAQMLRPVVGQFSDRCPDKAKPIWPNWICVPIGTGCSLAGLVYGLKQQSQQDSQVLGINVLKGAQYTEAEIRSQLADLFEGTLESVDLNSQWQVNHNYHFGGYGKRGQALSDFMAWFQQQHQIILDPVYTAKLFYGVYDLIKKGFFAPGGSIMLIHTGGLQGARGLSAKNCHGFKPPFQI